MSKTKPEKKRREKIHALTVFAVSDATGETAERIVRSALVQFEDASTVVVRRGHVRTQRDVIAVVREAAGSGALILHTLVADKLRRIMLEEARLGGVDSMDLLGPVLDRMASRLRLTPMEKPGLLKQLAEARTREIEAVEFAFRHDDGQHPEELEVAEIVIVGVSRTMKTPTTLYLSYRGWFAANVPIIPESEQPGELLALPAHRIFCLDMAEERLLELRRTRAYASKIPLEPYASPLAIREELLFARRLSREQGWCLIDVTGKSVEEVAREIIALLAWEEGRAGTS